MSHENLKKVAELVGKKKGFTVELTTQVDAAYTWKTAAIHPMQALQNISQRVVREAVRKVDGDDAKRAEVSKQLSAFCYFDAATPKSLPAPRGVPTGDAYLEERLEGAAKELRQLRKAIKSTGDVAKVEARLTDLANEVNKILEAVPDAPKAATDLKSKLQTEHHHADLAAAKKAAADLDEIVSEARGLFTTLGCIANFYVIEPFFLWRLMVKFTIKPPADDPSKVVDAAAQMDVSGELTGLLHNGKEGTAWMTKFITEKLVELDGALKDLDGDNLYFYLKGGRALCYAMDKKEEGTNDFDTGIIINPNLPVDAWYELLRKVHNLCLEKLRKFKHELLKLMETNADTYKKYLEEVEQETVPPPPPPPEESDKVEKEKCLADAVSQLMPAATRANAKAELIDIGVPRRDTPEVWETWALKPQGKTGDDGMPYPGPLYFVNEYVTMIREVLEPGARGAKKSPKRLQRLFKLLDGTAADASVEEEKEHIPPDILPKALDALGPFEKTAKVATIVLKQLADAHLLREDTGFCKAFDDYFVDKCSNPGTTDIPEELAKANKDTATSITLAKHVNALHKFSKKIEKHVKDRGEFFKKHRKEFGRFVKAIYTASIFNKADEDLEIMFAISGSFAARLHAEYADYEHMEDIEPFNRVDIRVYCKEGHDPKTVMEVVVPAILEAYKSHPETPEYNQAIVDIAHPPTPKYKPLSTTPTEVIVNLYWPSEETMGDLTYAPLVIRLSAAPRELGWPQLSFVRGYPVLSLRDLAWDYLRLAGITEEFGARARFRKTAEALMDILTRYENPGAATTGSAPDAPKSEEELPGVPLPEPEVRKEVPITNMPQAKSNWCWATVSAMMRRYFLNEDIEPPAIVREQYPSEIGAEPDERGSLRLIGLQYDPGQDVTLSWSQIKEELDHDRPFIFGSRGHYYVATGYVEQGPRKRLRYWNPLPVGVGKEDFMTYDQYVGTVGTVGGGGATYANIRRRSY